MYKRVVIIEKAEGLDTKPARRYSGSFFGKWISIIIPMMILFCLPKAFAQSDLGLPQTVASLPIRLVQDYINQQTNVLVSYGFYDQQGNPANPVITATYEPSPAEVSKKIRNVISLSIDEETGLLIPADFTASVNLQVEYGHDPQSLNTVNIELSVSYNKDAGVSYKARDYFSFDNAEVVKVTLVSFNIPPPNGNFHYADVLKVENEIQSVKYFTLSDMPALQQTAGISDGLLSSYNDYYISWKFYQQCGENFTQLEWTWVEEDMLSTYYQPGTINVDQDLLFKNNSTRVELSRNRPNKAFTELDLAGPQPLTRHFYEYSIPLIYPGKGKIYYRIRPVNMKEDGKNQYGIWTYGESQVLPADPQAVGFEANKNWQSTTSFAEDGKRKSVVQFYDGTLRSRQTVTRDNQTNNVVVAETFYDGQGRPAIQVLPVPGIGNIIEYKTNLNLFNSQAPNEDPINYFDLQALSPNPTSATALNYLHGGAAKYYSSANPDQSGFNKYIPDAEGFPYTHTLYDQDGSGRVKAQSGVGFAMRIGSGHETEYYYGQPAQEELDALFGTEAGFKTHYFKTMVKDANGQTSVSYTDMHGRTIATSLAGNSPANLQPLNLNSGDYPNQSGNVLVRDLLADGSNTVKDNNKVEAINTLLVPALTDFSFSYKFTPQVLESIGCPPANIPLCYDCLYDLEIVITDESGNIAPIVRKFSNLSMNNTLPDDDCQTPNNLFHNSNGTTPATPTPTNLINFTESLPRGSYVIRKTLSISEASLQYYKNIFLPKALCKTEQQIIDSVYQVLQTQTGCANNDNPQQISCQSCLDDLGSFPDYQQAYMNSLGLTQLSPQQMAVLQANYNDERERCEIMCTNQSQLLNSKRKLMEKDMMPYRGQYALDPTLPVSQQVQEINTQTSTMYSQYDIFATANHPPFFRRPKKLNSGNNQVVDDYYYDFTNVIDNAAHPTGTTNPYQALDGMDRTQFKAVFKNKWAESLLPYHPEYRKLLFAEQHLTAVYDFATQLNGVNTYDGAMQQTWILQNNFNISQDPFYQINDPMVIQFKNDMISYLFNSNPSVPSYQQIANAVHANMWQLARASFKCDNASSPNMTACIISAGQSPVFDLTTNEEKNLLWKQFRRLYLAKREEHVNRYITSQTLPAVPNAQLISQKYIVHFPEDAAQMGQQYGGTDPNGWNWIPTVPGGPPPSTVYPPGPNNPVSTQYSDRCSSYVNLWKNQLFQCESFRQYMTANPQSPVLNTIIDRMLRVCIAGSDANNMLGSSTVAPNTPASMTYRSFEQIINEAFASINIPKSNYCNPFVIEYPKPYGKNSRLSNEIISELDSCHCNRWSQIKAQAQQQNYNPNNFTSLNQYLSNTYNQTINIEIFNAFQHCNQVTQQVCVPGTVTLEYDCSGEEPECPTVINQNNGKLFKQSGAYRMFILSPQKKPAGKATPVNGQSLQVECIELEEFLSFFHTLPESQAGECQGYFVEIFNAHFNVQMSYSEILDLYLATCCYIPAICPAPFDNQYLALAVSDFYQTYDNGIDESPDCQNLFVEFFNQYDNNNFSYTWTEIVQFYMTAFGHAPNVCLENGYTCEELQALVEQFLLDNTGISVTECRCKFTEFFNQYYNTNLSWNEIVQIYMHYCEAPPRLCGNEGNCEELSAFISQFHEWWIAQGQLGECEAAFLEYYNAHHSPALTWNELQALLEQCKLVICRCTKTCSVQICHTVSQPYTLSTALEIPAFLGCNYSPDCLTCADISNLTAEFKTIMNVPGGDYHLAPIISQSNIIQHDIERNKNYARFLNFRTGFQYNWEEYLLAAQNANPTCSLNNYQNNGQAFQTVICRNIRPVNDPHIVTHEPPCQHTYNMAVTIGANIYQSQMNYLLAALEASYRQKCLNVAEYEEFKVTYSNPEYHFTLYYYDQAGNLVKTIPPKGVHPDYSTSFLADVRDQRNSGNYLVSPLTPNHSFRTEYRYNSLNQVVMQLTPDAGISSFWYDRLGRLVVSQNSQQENDKHYSYTRYDALGRIVEVGQKFQLPNSMSQAISQDPVALEDWLNASTGERSQITMTVYDVPAHLCNAAPQPSILCQNNLRNRVSYSMVFDTEGDIQWFSQPDMPDIPINGYAATYYSYDVHGNVDQLVQDFHGISGMDGINQYKKIGYDYDLISGKVNQVSYQEGQPDAYYHQYRYDCENRITEVLTSRDKIYWEKDAAYEYYKHGPLARTELGQLKVQGLDYAYTLQGWLKGVNSSLVDPAYDMGGDGLTASARKHVARDVLGFVLHYYDETLTSPGNPPLIQQDYKPLGSNQAFARPDAGANMLSLYNGNIAAMAVNNQGLALATSGVNSSALFNRYKYDQLNRLVDMQVSKGLQNNNIWGGGPVDDYHEAIKYDPNGNIMEYLRNGAPGAGQPLKMDELSYRYYDGSNRLQHVGDAAGNSANYPDDIDNQSGTTNYTYDKIGNLIGDAAEGLSISWTVYGKIRSIDKQNGDDIAYRYDASGNRIYKQLGDNNKTIYVRDASGNVMGVYVNNGQTNQQTVQKEVHLYGSSRIGVLNPDASLNLAVQAMASDFGEGLRRGYFRTEKVFELTNHLGNVLATITDKKLQQGNNGVLDYYVADVATATDYYPFGMQMPGRKYTAPNSNYRYGFNGKENDKDAGEGVQDYGMRIYDVRLGRFLSVDPLFKEYPWNSTYAFAENEPIANIDLDGEEKKHYTLTFDEQGNAVLTHTKTEETYSFLLFFDKKYDHVINTIHYNGNTYNFHDNNHDYSQLQAHPEWNYGADYHVNSQADFVRKKGEGYVSEEQAGKKALLNAASTGADAIARGGATRGFYKSKTATPKTTTNQQATAANGGNANAANANTAGVTLKNTSPQQGAGFKSYNTKVSDGKVSMVTAKGAVNTNGRYDFVVTNEGKLVIGTGHYNLSGGASSVQAAGQIKIVNGQLREITNSSGHYQPTVQQGQQSVNVLQNAGVNTTGARVSLYNADGSLNKTYINK